MPRDRNATAPVRFAVVGLGYFAQAAILPAFRRAKGATLAALVSDDPAKLRELGERYEVPHLLSYGEYDAFLRSGAVDAVYIALPNDLHADFTVRAAKAGVHVLCEKPMATTARDGRRMMAACRRAKVRLMVAYRLHFEAANLEAIERVRDGTLGEPRFFTSRFAMQVVPGGIRTKAERGGGPLYDIGLYCINAARYLFRAEPTSALAVAASGPDARFRETEEQASVILTFPGARLASFTVSNGAFDMARYTVAGTKGALTVDNAYEFTAPIRHELETRDGTRRRKFRKRDQVAPELEHFARCVRTGRDPEPSGREGLNDLLVLEAIQRSAATGRRVPIRAVPRRRRPSLWQEAHRRPHRMPRLVHAKVPFES